MRRFANAIFQPRIIKHNTKALDTNVYLFRLKVYRPISTRFGQGMGNKDELAPTGHDLS